MLQKVVTVRNNNCFKGSSTVSFVSTSSDCTSDCNKIESVSGSGDVATFKINKDSCSASICMYVHDGSFKLAARADAPDQDDCVSNDNQLCHLCDYVNLKVRVVP